MDKNDLLIGSSADAPYDYRVESSEREDRCWVKIQILPRSGSATDKNYRSLQFELPSQLYSEMEEQVEKVLGAVGAKKDIPEWKPLGEALLTTFLQLHERGYYRRIALCKGFDDFVENICEQPERLWFMPYELAQVLTEKAEERMKDEVRKRPEESQQQWVQRVAESGHIQGRGGRIGISS